MRRDRVRPRVQPVECTAEPRDLRHVIDAYDAGVRTGRRDERRRWREQISGIVDEFGLRDRYDSDSDSDDDPPERGWIP